MISIKSIFLKALHGAWFFIQTCFTLLVGVVIFLVTLLFGLCMLFFSVCASVWWYIHPKYWRRARYRKWLRSELKKKLRGFRGNSPLILHISGPSGFDWRSSQSLKPGEMPEWEGYRPVPVGSDDWHGYVHYRMFYLRHKFTDEEVFPIIAVIKTIVAFKDL